MKSLEKFINKAILKHGTTYSYDKVIYNGCRESITINCKSHGDFEQKPYIHLLGHGCNKCSIERCKNVITISHFLKESTKIHNKYSYDKILSTNLYTSDLVTITCKNHGDFTQKVSNHLKGQGCRKCYTDNKRLSNNDFIIKCIKIHGDEYDYSKTNYTIRTETIIITCKKHGDFDQFPQNHINGHGCNLCNITIGEKKIEKYLSSNHINFMRENRFDGCANKRKLPFDFYLPEYNMCIEYDGEFHYIPIFGEDKLNKTKNNDNIKNKYCKENDINLIRIPYWDFDNIDEILENTLSI